MSALEELRIDLLRLASDMAEDGCHDRALGVERAIAHLDLFNADHPGLIDTTITYKGGEAVSALDEWKELSSSWQGHSIGGWRTVDLILYADAAIAELEAALADMTRQKDAAVVVLDEFQSALAAEKDAVTALGRSFDKVRNELAAERESRIEVGRRLAGMQARRCATCKHWGEGTDGSFHGGTVKGTWDRCSTLERIRLATFGCTEWKAKNGKD